MKGKKGASVGRLVTIPEYLITLCVSANGGGRSSRTERGDEPKTLPNGWSGDLTGSTLRFYDTIIHNFTTINAAKKKERKLDG